MKKPRSFKCVMCGRLTDRPNVCLDDLREYIAQNGKYEQN